MKDIKKYYFFLYFLALDSAIAIACFLGLPALSSFLILADICDFGSKSFWSKMNYLSFQWLLRCVFTKR